MRFALTNLAVVVAIMCALPCFVGSVSTAFVGGPLATDKAVHRSRFASGTPMVDAARHAGAGGSLGGSSVSSTGLAAFAATALAVAAVRRKQSRVARRVTLAEIEAMTVEDLPLGWRPKVSVNQSKKNVLVQSIKRQLDNTFFLMAFNKDGMTTPELEEARNMFPQEVVVRCLKNTLVKKAMQGTEWEPFSENLKGPNMYVFAQEDNMIKGCIESYLKAEKKFNREARLAQLRESMGEVAYDVRPLVGGVIRDEWNFIPPKDFPALKNFPTKLELIARIAGGIKQVPQKLAVGINALPKKIAVGTKKIVEKMEEEGKSTVADVAA